MTCNNRPPEPENQPSFLHRQVEKLDAALETDARLAAEGLAILCADESEWPGKGKLAAILAEIANGDAP